VDCGTPLICAPFEEDVCIKKEVFIWDEEMFALEFLINWLWCSELQT
jgi:hypothetical protein